MDFKTVHAMYQHWHDTRIDQPAYYVKSRGQWQPVMWREYYEKITSLAIGLMAMGMEHRDPVSILGLTRPEWDIADKAVLSAGGVAVGVYHSNTPEQVHHVVHHSESRMLIVENREQWDKVLQIRDQLPLVKQYILMDPTGIDDPDVTPFEEVLRLGREKQGELEGEYRKRFESVEPEDTAIIFYTSGTTGPPKGAMLSHGNVLAACEAMDDLGIFSPEDSTVLWLPMPHIYGRIAMIASTFTNTPGTYAESLDKIVENIKEIAPTAFYSVPRIFEKVYTRVLGEVEKGSAVKRAVFQWARGVGLARSRALQEGKSIPLLVALQYRLAYALVFKKIREAFGGRIKILISGGAPISREIIEFFHAADIMPLELYGITETLLCTMNRPHKFRFGTVGVPGYQVELRIADDGEIMVRSPMVFKGYLKEKEKTDEVLSPDGWYATGDIGKVDKDGFLWITDRKKDILITAGGKNVAPQNIENLMKNSIYINQAMVYGDRKPFLTALVTLDEDEITKWAEGQGIPATDLKALSEHPKVLEMIESEIKAKNADLAKYEQVKYFRIIPEEFSQEGGTLTATMKVRRREVIKQFGDLLEGFYTK